jgi:TonB family protein
MYDRVTEVLAQRRTLDHSAAAGLALSVALHAGIGAALVYAALHQPPPQTANILTIKFQGILTSAAAPIAPPAAPKKVVKPAVKPALPPPPVTETVSPPNPIVTKNTAPPDPFGRSNKKPALAPLPPPAAVQQTPNPAGGVAKVNDIVAGTSGVTGIEGGDFPYTIYIERMKNLIGSHWFRPQAATGAVTIHFVINRDGSVRDAALESPSGNSTFDRAALRAVMETSPLPPLPFAYSGTYLGVHLTFK